MTELPAPSCAINRPWTRRAQELVESAARDHDLDIEAIIEPKRQSRIANVRNGIIRQLDAEGCHPKTIARLFEIDRTTVLYHLGRAKSWQRVAA